MLLRSRRVTFHIAPSTLFGRSAAVFVCTYSVALSTTENMTDTRTTGYPVVSCSDILGGKHQQSPRCSFPSIDPIEQFTLCFVPALKLNLVIMQHRGNTGAIDLDCYQGLQIGGLCSFTTYVLQLHVINSCDRSCMRIEIHIVFWGLQRRSSR